MPHSATADQLVEDLIHGGLNLIVERSRLARWVKDKPVLLESPAAEYEHWVSGQGDYARLASWVLFSVGGE